MDSIAERSVVIKLKLDASDVDRRAALIAAGLTEVGKSAKEAGDKLDILNRKLDETGRALTSATMRTIAFDIALGETKTRLKDLNEEFAKSGMAKFAQATIPAGTGLDSLKTKVQQTTDEQTKLGDKTEDVGRSFKKLEGESSSFEAALRVAKARSEELRTEFEKTGDEKSLEGYRKIRREVNRLEADFKSAKREAADVRLGDGQVGQAIGSVLNVSPSLGVTIVTAIAATSPLIAAAFAGALGAGVGMAGIAAGIVGQLHDPAVVTAAHSFATDLKDALTAATGSFAEPIQLALDSIGTAIKGVIGGINFTELAGAFTTLSQGIAGFISELGPGLTAAFHDSVPLINILAQMLPDVGRALGDMLHEIANSSGAAAGLRSLLDLIMGTLDALGHIIGALSNTYSALLSVSEAVGNFFKNAFHAVSQFFDFLNTLGGELSKNPLFGWLTKVTGGISDLAAGAAKMVHELHHGAGSSLDQFAGHLSDTAVAASFTAMAVDNLRDSINGSAETAKAFGQLLQDLSHTAGTAAQMNGILAQTYQAIGDANLSAHDKVMLLTQAYHMQIEMQMKSDDLQMRLTGDIDALSQSVKKNGHSLDLHTMSGSANYKIIRDQIIAINEMEFAENAEGHKVDETKAKHDKQIETLKVQAKHLGFNRDEVNNLVKAYDHVPANKNTKVEAKGFDTIFNELRDTLVAQIMLMNPGDTKAEALRTLRAHGYSRAQGGRIDGVGGDTADNQLAWLSPGEHVWTAREVRAAGGHTAVETIRQQVLDTQANPGVEFAGDGSSGLAYKIRGFALGGPVVTGGPVPGDYTFVFDASKTKIPPAEAPGMLTGGVPWNGTMTPSISAALSYLRGANMHPYGWAQAGPWSYDCSGIVSMVWNVLHGRYPYNHTFSTSNEAGYFPFGGAGGVMTAGWANPGERGGGSVGHTAAVLAGQPFESTGSRGVHLSGVTPISNFAHVGHFDKGGYLAPGWNLAYNGLGRPEGVAGRGQFVSDRGGGRVIHEYHIIIEGTGLLNGLRKEIRGQGGDVQEVLGRG